MSVKHRILPQTQLIRHCPPDGRWGDCYRTAAATVLAVPAEQVPHVFDEGRSGEDGQSLMMTWLARNGLTKIEIRFSGEMTLDDVLCCMEHANPGRPFMLSGRSPRGEFNHTVVACGGAVVSDPSHEPAPLVGPMLCPDGGRVWIVEYLVREL